MSFVPSRIYTQYSLLTGFNKPKKLAKKCAKYNYRACAVTDRGNMSGIIDFIEAMRKENIKPILGCEFNLSPFSPDVKTAANSNLSSLLVLAKNKSGYSELISRVSQSNKPEYFHRVPRLSLDKFQGVSNLLAFSGGINTELFNVLFEYDPEIYNTETPKNLLDPDFEAKAIELINSYQEIFGKDNFFVELQLHDQAPPASILAVNIYRNLAKKYKFQTIATNNSYYTNQDDAEDHRILLCSKHEANLQNITKKLSYDFFTKRFFDHNNFHLPAPSELENFYSEAEIKTADSLADICEEYDIFSKPMLPKFDCEGDPSEYLLNLCRQGWNKFSQNIPKEKYKIYGDRVKSEMSVINSYDILVHYFLIVHDYVNHVKSQGQLIGPGRGSAAGCLVSRLLGITSIDPIQYDLMFERFYNSGRNTGDHIELPDIDIDFGRKSRGDVIKYIKSKYGENNVSGIVTFGRMMGKEALKTVLRCHNACDFETMNNITENIPDEASIADDLQRMKENGEDPSILMYMLKYESDKLEQWCHIKDDKIVGDYASYFAQAIRLEGTKRTQSRHASGYIISPLDLTKACPMIYDKSNKELIPGIEMDGLKKMGHVKFDILGVSLIDKVSDI